MSLFMVDVDEKFLHIESIRFYNQIEKVHPVFLRDIALSNVFIALKCHTEKPFDKFLGGNNLLINQKRFKNSFFFSLIEKFLINMSIEQRNVLFNTAIKKFNIEKAKDVLQINHWLEEISSHKDWKDVKLSFAAIKVLMLILEHAVLHKNEMFAKRYGFSLT